jgi:hypothetical protein
MSRKTLSSTQSPFQWLVGSFWRVKLPGPKLDNLQPYRAKVKKEWNYTPTLPLLLHSRGRNNCFYLLYPSQNFYCHFHINPLKAELNPICLLLALLGVYNFLHFSRIRVKSLTLRLLILYIYIYDISSLRVNLLPWHSSVHLPCIPLISQTNNHTQPPVTTSS